MDGVGFWKILFDPVIKNWATEICSYGSKKIFQNTPYECRHLMLSTENGRFILVLQWIPEYHFDYSKTLVLLQVQTVYIYRNAVIQICTVRGRMFWGSWWICDLSIALSSALGCTWEFGAMVNYIKKTYPQTQLVVVGFSLGGNIVCKYLGENQANQENVLCCVSVCQGYSALR